MGGRNVPSQANVVGASEGVTLTTPLPAWPLPPAPVVVPPPPVPVEPGPAPDPVCAFPVPPVPEPAPACEPWSPIRPTHAAAERTNNDVTAKRPISSYEPRLPPGGPRRRSNRSAVRRANQRAPQAAATARRCTPS